MIIFYACAGVYDECRETVAYPPTGHSNAWVGENGVKIKIIQPFCVIYKKRFIFVICNIAFKRILTDYLFII